jgi:AcrR family transcriptional regulator
MEAVAEAAQVAKGTVYLYYPSKRAIYDAVFAAGMAEIESLISARVAAASTAREAIAGFVTVRTEYFQQHPDFFRVYVAELARQVAAGADDCGTCQMALERQTRALQRVIEKAVAAGAVRAVDPEAAALAVFDMSKGLVGRRLLIGARSTVQRDIAFITDLIWSGLKPARGKKR